MQIKRFGVSLEENLLEELDKLVEEHRFPNRSQAIRYFINKNKIEDQWEKDEDVAGAIVLIYDHHKRELNSQSMKLQHDYHHLILSVQHVHLDHNNCLETIAVKGRASELKTLADSLIGLKGIKHGDLVMSTSS